MCTDPGQGHRKMTGTSYFANMLEDYLFHRSSFPPGDHGGSVTWRGLDRSEQDHADFFWTSRRYKLKMGTTSKATTASTRTSFITRTAATSFLEQAGLTSSNSSSSTNHGLDRSEQDHADFVTSFITRRPGSTTSTKPTSRTSSFIVESSIDTQLQNDDAMRAKLENADEEEKGRLEREFPKHDFGSEREIEFEEGIAREKEKQEAKLEAARHNEDGESLADEGIVVGGNDGGDGYQVGREGDDGGGGIGGGGGRKRNKGRKNYSGGEGGMSNRGMSTNRGTGQGNDDDDKTSKNSRDENHTQPGNRRHRRRRPPGSGNNNNDFDDDDEEEETITIVDPDKVTIVVPPYPPERGTWPRTAIPKLNGAIMPDTLPYQGDELDLEGEEAKAVGAHQQRRSHSIKKDEGPEIGGDGFGVLNRPKEVTEEDLVEEEIVRREKEKRENTWTFGRARAEIKKVIEKALADRENPGSQDSPSFPRFGFTIEG
ncbi:unnamed protein product [Amoebophrya sp. A25]|nr:unnamed protein product [Amoebophrya sp. A25]|eukprot:GSA25T00008774001.1